MRHFCLSTIEVNEKLGRAERERKIHGREGSARISLEVYRWMLNYNILLATNLHRNLSTTMRQFSSRSLV